MPYKHGKRKKHRTHHVPGPGAEGEKVPKSFVLRRGKVDKSVKELVSDVRLMCMPHTADHLRERKSNTLKDFVSVAGPLGVSHMVLFSQTEAGNVHMRVGRMARGPTLTFRLDSYTLARQVKAAQKRPADTANSFMTPPLVVLHNFANAGANASVKAAGQAGVSMADALKMTMVTFQNMFPPINPATVKLSDCRRVLLVHYKKDTQQVEIRHFLIRAVPVGVSRGVKKVLHSKLPNLHKLDDVSQFVLSGGRTGAGGQTSESEFEDESSRVVLPQDFIGKGNTKSQQSAIKLSEIGPRLSLTLVKIEDGLFDGEVLYHAFVNKSNDEAAELRKRAADRVASKAERRAQQEANVKRKEEEKKAKKVEKDAKRALKQEAAAKAAAEGRLGEEEEEEEEGNDIDNDDAGSESDGGRSDDDADADAEEDSGDDVTDDEDDGVAAVRRAVAGKQRPAKHSAAADSDDDEAMPAAASADDDEDDVDAVDQEDEAFDSDDDGDDDADAEEEEAHRDECSAAGAGHIDSDDSDEESEESEQSDGSDNDDDDDGGAGSAFASGPGASARSASRSSGSGAAAAVAVGSKRGRGSNSQASVPAPAAAASSKPKGILKTATAAAGGSAAIGGGRGSSAGGAKGTTSLKVGGASGGGHKGGFTMKAKVRS